MDKQYLDFFPSEFIQTTSSTWRLIKVADGPLGFAESGIVSSIAEPLSKGKICLFYVSTFSTDYTLVEESSFEEAIICLKKSFEIKES